MFLAALRSENFHAVAGLFGQNFFDERAIFEIHRGMDVAREIARIEIQLLDQRGQKFLRIKFFQVFPVKIAAIHDFATAQVE